MLWRVARAKLLNLQSARRAYDIGEHHYDRGNDLFEAMLGSRMSYSCGYWRGLQSGGGDREPDGGGPDMLAEAQAAKLDLVCRKLGLEAGDRVLDVGCGWGSFLRYAADEYGTEGVGLTVSGEQARLARERCRGWLVEIQVQDYRAFAGERSGRAPEPDAFDHAVSIGMFEHVGPKNYAAFFDAVRRLLAPGGLFLLETIGARRSSSTTNAWMNKYIFPGGSCPFARQLADALEERFASRTGTTSAPIMTAR
jgi:cyclopropane-fatty-acyl-phospholipid synthase